MTGSPGRVHVGLQLPHYGPMVERASLAELVQAAVAAGFDGIWASDHVVLVEGHRSRYPYFADGSVPLEASTPWLEAVTTLAAVAVLTEDIDLGVSVLVLPQRAPVLLAKQLATIDRLSGGRLLLGVGVGWLAEERAALGFPFPRPGTRTNDALRLLKACWTGLPPAGTYGDLSLPPGVNCFPRPTSGTIPILVGGNSPPAWRRAALHGDGWLGVVPAEGLSPGELADLLRGLRRACSEAGRDTRGLDLGLRMAVGPEQIGSAGLRDLLARYAELGIARFAFDVPAAASVAEAGELYGQLLGGTADL
jgi:probable F420-dependent oxidoreductase